MYKSHGEQYEDFFHVFISLNLRMNLAAITLITIKNGD